MKKFADGIVKSRFVLTGIFVVLIALCSYFATTVKINYDMLKYLDESSESTIALNKMEEEFGSVGSASVMVSGITKDVAEEIQVKIESVEGVNSVVFDSTNENCYKGDKALYQIFLKTGDFDQASYDTVDNIRDVLSNYNVAMTGTTVLSKFISSSVTADMGKILLVACIVVFGILLLTSSSWIDPIVFTITVAGAIIINMGTNVWMGEISFITQAICAVMQLALAMDYSIILLHSFNGKKKLGQEPKKAMKNALAESFRPISSSSITTISGLIALVFMSFSIGFDIGMVLAKGILASVISVFLFMPGLLLIFNKGIEKTSHRSIFEIIDEKRQKKIADKKAAGQKVRNIESFQYSTRIIIPVVAVCLIAAGCILNYKQKYSYNLEGSNDPNAQIVVEDKAITETFGIQNNMVVILPKDDYDAQRKIADYITNYTQGGVKVINSSQSLIQTGIYDSLSAHDVASNFGLPSDTVEKIYTEMGHKATDKVKVYDILVYLKKNQTIEKTIAASQKEIDDNYAQSSMLFVSMTSKDFAAKFGLPQNIIDQIYTAMNVSSVEPYKVLLYIRDNNFATKLGANMQQEINTNADASKALLDATQLQAAENFINLYQNTTDEQFKASFTEQVTSANSALAKLTKAEVLANPNFAFYNVSDDTRNILDSAFASFNLDPSKDSIYVYQLLDFTSKQKVASNIFDSIQAQINAAVGQYNPEILLQAKTLLANFSSLYTAEQLTGDATAFKNLFTQTYAGLKTVTTALSEEQLLASPDFKVLNLSKDAIDSFYSTRDNEVQIYYILQYIVQNDLIENTYNDIQQRTVDKNASVAASYLDPKTLEQEQDFQAQYDPETASAEDTQRYTINAQMLHEFSFDEAMSNYPFLTNDVLTSIFGRFGIDPETGSIANYRLVYAMSSSANTPGLVSQIGTGVQKVYNDKYAEVAFNSETSGASEENYLVSLSQFVNLYEQNDASAFQGLFQQATLLMKPYTKAQAKAEYAFLTDDGLDLIWNDYNAAADGTIENNQLLTSINNYQLASKFGVAAQKSIDENATAASVMFDDSTRNDATSLIANYSNDAKTFKSLYTPRYVSLTQATAKFNLEDALAGYPIVDKTVMEKFFTDYNLDPSKDSIYLFQLLQEFEKENSATVFGKTTQETVNTQSVSIDKLLVNVTKSDVENQFMLTSDMADALFAAYNTKDSIPTYEVLEYCSKNQSIKTVGESISTTLNSTFDEVKAGQAMLENDEYTRLVFNLNEDFSSQEAFDSITDIKKFCDENSDENYLVSSSATYKDIKDVYNQDMVKVNLISFIAILIICIITFGSFVTPVLLTVLIQGTIWISMGINTLSGTHIFFVSYLVVMCIQMGATVDYGILITTKYLRYRKEMSKRDAISLSMRESLPTILTSGTILVVAAAIVGLVSNVSVISEIGMLLSRGCLISILMVVLAWPQILMLFDKVIEKTTLKAKFFEKTEEK